MTRCLMCTEIVDTNDHVTLEIRACAGPYKGMPAYLCSAECIGMLADHVDDWIENEGRFTDEAIENLWAFLAEKETNQGEQ